MPTGSAGNTSPTSVTVGSVVAAAARRLHRALHGLGARVLEHGARQHVLRFRMRRHAESGHVDADDAHAVDLLRQQLQGHPGGGRHAQVDDDDGVVERRVGELVYRFADVLEQLAGHQRFGIEGHVADGAPRAVEMRREGQSVHAACRTRQHGRRAAHSQSHAQRAECRTHALRLIVRAGRIVGGVLRQRFGLAGGRGRAAHLLLAGVAAQSVSLGGRLVDDRVSRSWVRRCRRRSREWLSRRANCRTCLRGTQVRAPRCGRPPRS